METNFLQVTLAYPPELENMFANVQSKLFVKKFNSVVTLDVTLCKSAL